MLRLQHALTEDEQPVRRHELGARFGVRNLLHVGRIERSEIQAGRRAQRVEEELPSAGQEVRPAMRVLSRADLRGLSRRAAGGGQTEKRAFDLPDQNAASGAPTAAAHRTGKSDQGLRQPAADVQPLERGTVKKATDRLSGDQNGNTAPSVPASACGVV